MNKLIKSYLTLCIVGVASITQVQAISKNDFIQSYSNLSNVKTNHIPLLYQAEENASPAGQAVLRQARKSALEQRKIVKGSCWDYLNYVFNTAGFPNNKNNRKLIFKGKLRSGPYINTHNLQSGDWVYHINHSYHNIEHSGMFVGWVDKSKNKALMFSYAGQNRRTPARYKTYDLSHVYSVMRPSFDGKKNKYTSISSKKSPSTPKQTIKRTVKQPIFVAKPTKMNIPTSHLKPDQISHSLLNQNHTEKSLMQKYRGKNNITPQYLSIIHQAEQNSCGTPLKILRQARKMTLDTKEIVTGTSQNYVRVLFERAGMKHRDFFMGNRYKGSFVNTHAIKSGDWLSFINHEYHDSEHSGIFIGWLDKSQNKALMVSYSGEGRKDPARYRAYDVSHVYHVRRPNL